MLFKKLLTIIFAIISMVSTAQIMPDTLQKYLEIAAKNNPLVQQKFYEYQAALQKIPQAGSLPDPQLSFGIFLKPMELVNGRQIADATLMQMFPWFGVLRNAKDEMSLMANAKFEEFRDSRLQLFYDIQRNWYDLYKLRKDISISEKNIDILRIIEDLALLRFKTAPAGGSGSIGTGTTIQRGSSRPSGPGSTSGMPGMSSNPAGTFTQPSVQMKSGSMGSSSDGINLSDIYRIRIEMTDLENNILFLKDQENTLIARFNSFMNRPPDSNVYSIDTLIIDSLELSLVNIKDSITAGNPMLNMLEYERQSYLARQKMSKGMGYPMVGLGLNYMFIDTDEMAAASSMNGKDMIMPMVSLTLPIYRKKYKALQNEADLLSRAASQNFQATANALQIEYYTALEMYHNAKRRIRLYDEQFQLASKTLDLILKSFSTSGSDLTEVLRVQQQTLEYELSKTEAVTDFNTATAWLRRLMASSAIEMNLNKYR